MAENENFSNILSEKFPMPKVKHLAPEGAHAPDERTSAIVLAELEEHNKQSAELMKELRALQKTQKENLGDAVFNLTKVAKSRGD